MKKFRLMLIGCGNMARVHCNAYRGMPQLELISAVDINESVSKEFQKEYNFARTATNYREELAKGDIDIALICTHWQFRYEMIIDCLKANVNVLSEKPMTLLLDEQEAIFKRANECKLKVRVGMMERFRPMFLAIKAMLDNHKIGKVNHYSFIHHQSTGNLSEETMQAGWSYQKNLLKGGVTPNVDCGIHKCDMGRMLSGAEPVSVMSIGKKLESDSPSDNLTHSVFNMSDGSMITLEDCFSRNTRNFIYMWLLGDGGMINYEYAGAHLRPTNQSQEDYVSVWSRTKPATEAFHYPALIKPVKPQMEQFLQEITLDLDMDWHYNNVRQATEMVAASVLSEKRQAIVNFPLTEIDRQDISKLFYK